MDPSSLPVGGVKFTVLFMRYESLMITSASWVLIQLLQKSLALVGDSRLFIRLKPLMPVVISVIMAFLPTFRIGNWDETLLYGIVLGSLTGFGQKLLKQTILGMDSRLQPEEEKVEALPPSPGMVAAMPARPSRPRLREKIKHFIT